MTNSYDLVVIGSGPAGESAAVTAALLGKSVAVVEKAPHPGGAVVNTCTVPSKTLRETAVALSGLRTRDLFGVHVLGEMASEVVHIGVMALMQQAGADLFLRTCFNYPTLGELYKYATHDALQKKHWAG